jgi:hypothetical protein
MWAIATNAFDRARLRQRTSRALPELTFSRSKQPIATYSLTAPVIAET